MHDKATQRPKGLREPPPTCRLVNGSIGWRDGDIVSVGAAVKVGGRGFVQGNVVSSGEEVVEEAAGSWEVGGFAVAAFAGLESEGFANGKGGCAANAGFAEGSRAEKGVSFCTCFARR